LNSKPTPREREHLARVKSLECSLCDTPGPSAAHHIEQSQAYTCVALCHECHQGKHGWHGDRAYWKIRKMDELAALNVTIERLMA
jgi:hypothetical protein